MDDDTYSLTPSVLDYEYENGRRYHAYHAGRYLMPNDDKEQDRLDMLHHIYLLCWDGELHRAPLKSVRKALDVGCGTGIWAIDFADLHVEAEVTAIDLSPIQPSYVPENLQFEIVDIEDDWDYTEPFDYIHIRGMEASIGDWPRLIQQAYDNLAPGGVIEIFDFEARASTDDDSLPESSAYHQLNVLFAEAAEKMGKPVGVSARYPEFLAAAGFRDVCHETRKVPLTPWQSEPKMRTLGHYMQLAMSESFEPYTLATFTRALDWNYNMVQALIAGARQDLKNPDYHIYTVA
ncbi:hypothetical protein FQN50_005772 [Emmonsiellopsis sp. PD_5]|nr:hypothetical protein FQN50_005772 [Emmonsiellopsis sp. PD_5]